LADVNDQKNEIGEMTAGNKTLQDRAEKSRRKYLRSLSSFLKAKAGSIRRFALGAVTEDIGYSAAGRSFLPIE
jgi:hypothetical protein